MKLRYKDNHFRVGKVFFTISDVKTYGADTILLLLMMYDNTPLYKNEYWLNVSKIARVVKGRI